MIVFEADILNQLDSRGWRLVGPDGIDSDWLTLLGDVQQALGHPTRSILSDAQRLERAITYAYCRILLAACRENGSTRQESAFEELWSWIYPRVYARINHAQNAQDVAQKVLMRVYQNLHRVEKPHGFLGYVSVIIHREVIDYYQRKGKLDQFEQELPGDDDNDAGDGMDDLAGPDSYLEVEEHAAEEEIVRMIYDCMPKKKWRRAYALVALALKGQTVAEVAEALQITANAVYLLHFQAKRDLPKHCPELIELLLQQLAPSHRLSLLEGNS